MINLHPPPFRVLHSPSTTTKHQSVRLSNSGFLPFCLPDCELHLGILSTKALTTAGAQWMWNG